MLTYYYISALVFGYCAGYFLLLKPGGAFKRLAKAPVAGAWVLLFALPLGLAWRNLCAEMEAIQAMEDDQPVIYGLGCGLRLLIELIANVIEQRGFGDLRQRLRRLLGPPAGKVQQIVCVSTQ